MKDNFLYKKVITIKEIDDIPIGAIAYCIQDDDYISFSFPKYGWITLEQSDKEKFKII